jgi:hypothetical protein
MFFNGENLEQQDLVLWVRLPLLSPVRKLALTALSLQFNLGSESEPLTPTFPLF